MGSLVGPANAVDSGEAHQQDSGPKQEPPQGERRWTRSPFDSAVFTKEVESAMAGIDDVLT